MKSELLLVLALSLCVSSKPLSKRKTYNKLLLISFDGFRWDYDQDVDTPNLDKLVKEGVKAKYINPPAITMTSPSHFTTITGKMGKGKDLSEFDKGQIVMAGRLGQSISKTAALVGCSWSAVVSLYQKCSKEGTVENRPQGHGRPRLIDGRRLARVVPSNRRATEAQITQEVNAGRWLEDHGVVHNLMFNATTGLRLTHKATLKKSEWWDNGALPLWITAQNQGLKSASFFYPGGAANYSGQAVDRSLVANHDHPDDNETEWRQNIDTVMGWFTKENFDFVTLYYGEPDNVGHAVGPETPARRKIIEQIDRTIGYLKEAIHKNSLTDRLNVILTSDHGMTTIKKATEVNEIKLNNYMSFVNLSSFDLLDYGGFGMITPKKGKEQEVYEALKNAHPNLTVYKKEEIPEHFHIGKHERIQPIVLLADLGFNINSRVILHVNKGDHGFSNEEMDMKMFFRAFGPDFKSNFLAEPFDSVSIYPLMCELLGVRPEANNGSLSDTKGMLVDNSDVGGSSGRIKVSLTLLTFMIAILTFI